MKTQTFLLAATISTLVFGAVNAQTPTDSRIAKLEETVRLLEQRVAALESQPREIATPLGVAPEKVAWRKLRNGMTQADVERLLGSPTKVDSGRSFTIWYFGYPIGGTVHFNGEQHTVTGWTEP